MVVRNDNGSIKIAKWFLVWIGTITIGVFGAWVDLRSEVSAIRAVLYYHLGESPKSLAAKAPDTQPPALHIMLGKDLWYNPQAVADTLKDSLKTKGDQYGVRVQPSQSAERNRNLPVAPREVP